MNKDVEFEQLSFDFSIYTEKDYTKETGVELEKPVKEIKQAKAKKSKRKKKKSDSENKQYTIKDIEKPPVVEEKPPVVEEKPPVVEEKPPVVEEKPPVVEEKPPVVEEKPPVVEEKPPVVEEKPPVVEEKPPVVSHIESITNKFIKAVTETNAQKIKAELASKNIEFPYVKRELLTNAEKQLYLFMRENIYLKEKVIILAKVRLGDIMDVDTRIVKSNSKAFYKIACKHVDYLIVDRNTFDIICAVELDDYTHETDKAKERDTFVYHALHEVGIELVRIKTAIKDISKKDLTYIENIIAAKYAPKCPVCGGEMLVRTSRKSHNLGHRFYGCAKNYGCCGNIDID